MEEWVDFAWSGIGESTYLNECTATSEHIQALRDSFGEAGAI